MTGLREPAPEDDPLTGERVRQHYPNEADGPMLDDEGTSSEVNHGENPQTLYRERDRPSLESGPAHQRDEDIEGGKGGGAN